MFPKSVAQDECRSVFHHCASISELPLCVFRSCARPSRCAPRPSRKWTIIKARFAFVEDARNDCVYFFLFKSHYYDIMEFRFVSFRFRVRVRFRLGFRLRLAAQRIGEGEGQGGGRGQAATKEGPRTHRAKQGPSARSTVEREKDSETSPRHSSCWSLGLSAARLPTMKRTNTSKSCQLFL